MGSRLNSFHFNLPFDVGRQGEGAEVLANQLGVLAADERSDCHREAEVIRLVGPWAIVLQNSHLKKK